jgi:2-amino-4-hydroxy-6-hydroxymethyldihydropteridine diphosphokinase
MIILGIGSNLSSSFGDRFENINLSLALLEKNEIEVNKVSSFYETPSYPNKKNPKFINVVVGVKTKLPPQDLASVLFFIEENLERKRNKKNDPRTCDIDIIDYNNTVINFKYKKQKFFIPHIDLENRNFVLYPLQEILPKWKHPINKRLIGDLIKKLSNSDKNSILKVKKY